MKKIALKKGLLFVIFFHVVGLIFCQSSQDYVAMADKAFKAGKKEDAKNLYLKAAAMNNGDAHFAIAYKFIVTDDESVYHFSVAAKLGNAEALGYALDELFFRAGSLTRASPEKAYALYQQAKKNNPSMKIYDEEEMISTIKKALEPGPFDATHFIKKYKITDEELADEYGVWELAQQASRGGRFGPPNPELVLQLVSRGGVVPAELIGAIGDTYQNWKNNKIDEFNICDYVTSGMGQAYCSAIDIKEADARFLIEIKDVSSKLKNNGGVLLPNAFRLASKFIEEKAWKEEGSDGSGYIAWANESIIKQKTDYLELVKKINNNVGLDSIVAVENADKELNNTYRKVLDSLTKKPMEDFKLPITAENVRSVQRRWILYRDSSAKLFAQIAPSVNENTWRRWLTEIRTKQLEEILEFGK
jgi:uncharacterized protein YecT (DUF1311 family)